MEKIQIKALRTLGLIVLACFASFMIHCMQMAILGDDAGNLSMSNPFISGFLHSTINHFITNMVILFLLLLPEVNRDYDFHKILWVTTILSFLYLPITILGITQPAIGISGTWFFLSSRYFLTWKRNPTIGKTIFWILLTAEIFGLTLPSDGVAHFMHILGSVLGYLSLDKSKVFRIFPQRVAVNLCR